MPDDKRHLERYCKLCKDGWNPVAYGKRRAEAAMGEGKANSSGSDWGKDTTEGELKDEKPKSKRKKSDRSAGQSGSERRDKKPKHDSAGEELIGKGRDKKSGKPK